MPLWKTASSVSANAHPKSVQHDNHLDELKTFANNTGWIARKPKRDMHGNRTNKDEILVAIRGLAGNTGADTTPSRLAASVIQDVRFAAGTLGLSQTSNVRVTFTQEVVVSNTTSSLPTVALTIANNTVAGGNTVLLTGQVATYSSGSGTNTLSFNFTTQTNAAAYTVTSSQNITLPTGAMIADKLPPRVASNLRIHSARAGANSAVKANVPVGST
jgi:hypothetical protein|tara:strand:+ start:470 stop:1117 length:648 start_codon:yes stop_codon:yes gene_type:complete